MSLQMTPIGSIVFSIMQCVVCWPRLRNASLRLALFVGLNLAAGVLARWRFVRLQAASTRSSRGSCGDYAGRALGQSLGSAGDSKRECAVQAG